MTVLDLMFVCKDTFCMVAIVIVNCIESILKMACDTIVKYKYKIYVYVVFIHSLHGPANICNFMISTNF